MSSEKFEVYLFIGSSILNYDSLYGLLQQVKEILMCIVLKLKKAKTMVIGANLSPMGTKGLSILRRFLLHIRVRTLDLITVRDQTSLKIIQQCAKNSTNTYYYPDILFGLPVIRKKGDTTCKTLGISAFYSQGMKGSDIRTYQRIAHIAKKYIETGKYRIALYAFDTGFSNDSLAMLELYRLIGNHENVELHFYHGDIEHFTASMAKCDLFIPVRFHSLVLCLKHRLPFIPLIYSNKVSNLLEDIRYHGQCFELPLIHDIDELSFEDMSIHLDMEECITSMKKASQGHFQEVRRIMRR